MLAIRDNQIKLAPTTRMSAFICQLFDDCLKVEPTCRLAFQQIHARLVKEIASSAQGNKDKGQLSIGITSAVTSSSGKGKGAALPLSYYKAVASENESQFDFNPRKAVAL